MKLYLTELDVLIHHYAVEVIHWTNEEEPQPHLIEYAERRKARLQMIKAEANAAWGNSPSVPYNQRFVLIEV